MSEKFIISDGYIGDVSEDITRTQQALCDNLQKRLHVMVESTGIRYADEDSFDILNAQVTLTGPGVYTVSVTLHNLDITVFSDYIITDPSVYNDSEDPEISDQFDQFINKWEGYIVLTREKSYKGAGTWRDGYPEGSPAQGDRVIEITSPALLLSDDPINDASHITLYHIAILPTTYHIYADYRLSQSLALRPIEDNSRMGSVQNLQVQSVPHHGALEDTKAVRGDFVYNTRSPHTNLMANEYMLRITWDSLNNDADVWAYDLRLSPISGETQMSIANVAQTYLVMAEDESLGHEILVPAAEGVKYDVRVRAIEKQHPRLAAAWSDTTSVVVGSDLLESIPASPTLEMQMMYEYPPVVKALIAVTDPPAKPYMVQLFKQVGGAQKSPVDSSILVYEGDPGGIQLVIKQDEEPSFRARVVGPGGVCSAPTAWIPIPEEPMGSGNLYYAEKLQIAVPILVKLDINSAATAAGYSYCAEFYPPTPGCYVTDMAFVGTGSYWYHDITVCQPEPLAENYWFQVEPSSYDVTADYSGAVIPVTQKGRLYFGEESTELFDIYDYQSDGHGGGPWAAGFAAIVCDDYHRYWETASNNDNYVPSQGFDATDKLRIMLRFDDYGWVAGDDFMVIVTGTLFLTLKMAEV